MQIDTLKNQTNDLFRLKDSEISLIRDRSAHGKVTLSIAELEDMRVNGRPISASRHGLEVICGASCETGAQ